MKRIVVIGLTLMVPLAAAAQTVADIIGRARSVVNLVIPLLASVAFAASLYGIIRFIASAGSEEKRSEAKKYVLYGLVGMFIIIAFWGILTVVANTFFGGSIGAPISISGIIPSTPSSSPFFPPSPSPTPTPNPNPNPFPIPPPSPTPNPNPTPNPTPTPCTPATCSSLNKQCGIWPDNCDSEISCGDCDYPQVCSASGQCAGSVAPNPTPTPTNGIVLPWDEFKTLYLVKGQKLNYVFRVTENARRMKILLIPNTISTAAKFTFKFPDGVRQYQGNLNYVTSATLDFRAQANTQPTIPDQYIPLGDYQLSVEALSDGILELSPVLYTDISSQPTSGQVLVWNVNHTVITFAPNETKTFILRVTTNSTGAYSRTIQMSFLGEGVDIVDGSFKIPPKPDGSSYETSNGTNEYTGLQAMNGGGISFTIGNGKIILNSPYIYPGDFILTMTADSQGGWGYMATSIYY